MWHCKYWYVYLLQTMEISLDHCEMWHFFKKHVNIFIIHKTMSLTAADTILMTTAMPMWPYLISLQPMKEQTNDGDINNKMMWPESSSLWMNLWSIHLLLLLMKTQNVSLTFCFYANEWNIQKKKIIFCSFINIC